MQKDLSRFVWSLGAALAVGISVCAGAAAQDNSLKPPAPTKADDPSFFTPLILSIAILAGCIGANLIPSKRGHQD